MTSQDTRVIRAMARFGGDFVRRLSHAARHADEENLSRIKLAFPEYWRHYARMAAREQKEATS